LSRVQSIERAFAVLTALTDGPVGVTEVAERAELPKSTAARMLASLAREGAVEQVPGETRYRLGPRIETLATGLGTTRSLVAVARPHLAELAAALGEAAGLSIPDGGEVHYVDQVDSPTPNPVGIRDWTGSRVAMHAVSSGLVFLAHRPAATVDRYLAGPLAALTDRTVTAPGEVRERLRAIARRYGNMGKQDRVLRVVAVVSYDFVLPVVSGVQIIVTVERAASDLPII